MKKAAFSVLVCLLVLLASKAKAQVYSWNNHGHDHLSYSIDTLVNDPVTGRVVLQVSMTVDLAGHPECIIKNSGMYIGYETWDDHWVLVDDYGTSATYTHTIEYNLNDNPYWLMYSFYVIYEDDTEEGYTVDVYF